jgi:hypothetical protein
VPVHFVIPTIADAEAIAKLHVTSWREAYRGIVPDGVLRANGPARAFYEAMGGRFIRDDVYNWDGNALDECIYLFENLPELARFA